jgi:Na+/H+ antiporter NhaC
MKFTKIKNYFHIAGYWVATFLAITDSPLANAQSPTHIPRTNPEPVGFFDSIENMVFYIIIPLVIAILYFLWKRNLARQKDREQEDQNNKS